MAKARAGATTINTSTPGRPVRAYFQEATGGDIRKFEARSNDSPTGGGARDLRVSPVGSFWNDMIHFFPQRISDRQYEGPILTGSHRQIITLMGPTDVRPNECRICQIPQIDSWRITQQEHTTITNAGHKWIYLLILDDQGQVWASKFSTDNLAGNHPNLINAITPLLHRRRTIRGIVTF